MYGASKSKSKSKPKHTMSMSDTRFKNIVNQLSRKPKSKPRGGK